MILAGSQQDFQVTENGRVVGVLTRGDLLTALAKERCGVIFSSWILGGAGSRVRYDVDVRVPHLARDAQRAIGFADDG